MNLLSLDSRTVCSSEVAKYGSSGSWLTDIGRLGQLLAREGGPKKMADEEKDIVEEKDLWTMLLVHKNN